ncbi:MAG TPA: GTPase ObgE [Candidatus Obscuribacterales bacterium]
MKIVDIAEITVSSGGGGNGAIAFRREKHVAHGGPTGGDGGRGGAVVFEASPNLHTLLDFRYQHHFKADDGEKGDIKNRSGRKGEDMVIPVPVGTVLKEGERVLCDLAVPGQRYLAAKGGKGGHGNAYFVNSVHQAPRYAEPGENGVTRQLTLELKTLADVGLVGLPNAGKSSLLSVISAARPKIADYPFTTLTPNLGAVRFPGGDGFIVADIPGLIEGASEGVGLGHDFLRHIERTRLLLHMVDASAPDPIQNYLIIKEELAAHPAKLDTKPQLIVLNKRDLVDEAEIEIITEMLREHSQDPVYVISAATSAGTRELLFAVQLKLAELPPVPLYEAEPEDEYVAEVTPKFEISREDDVYVITSEPLERMLELSDLEDPRALHRFQRRLYAMGIIDALKAQGAGTGDTVRIGWLEFDYL